MCLVKFFVRVSFEVSSFIGFFQHRIEPVWESTPMMSMSWAFMVGLTCLIVVSGVCRDFFNDFGCYGCVLAF